MTLHHHFTICIFSPFHILFIIHSICSQDVDCFILFFVFMVQSLNFKCDDKETHLLDHGIEPTGWWSMLRGSSNLLINFDWKRTFWNPTNPDEWQHVLCVKGRDDAKRVPVWICEQLVYPSTDTYDLLHIL